MMTIMTIIIIAIICRDTEELFGITGHDGAFVSNKTDRISSYSGHVAGHVVVSKTAGDATHSHIHPSISRPSLALTCMPL